MINRLVFLIVIVTNILLMVEALHHYPSLTWGGIMLTCAAITYLVEKKYFQEDK